MTATTTGAATAAAAQSGVPWVTSAVGITLTTAAAIPGGAHHVDAVELGLRHNPNRAQLLVSRLLGKHIPVPATTVLAAGHALGAAVRTACRGATPVVVGFAETATGLGHAVAAVAAADGGPAFYLHTTRRPTPDGVEVIRFLEEHSHATDQSLAIPDELASDVPLVLVDDELSTGRTAVNAIRALHAVRPRSRYILASLLDSRTPAQHGEVAAAVAALGATVESVRLVTGSLHLPDDVLHRAETARNALPLPPPARTTAAGVTVSEHTFSVAAPLTAALGWTRDDEAAARREAAAVAARLPVHRNGRTLVLGDEEYMYFPQLLAAALGAEVRTSTTTRSPAVAIDVPGYPIRTALRFPATNDPGRDAFAYNVAPSAHLEPGNAPGFDDIVFVADAALDGHVGAGLIAQLAAAARRSVHVVSVTRARQLVSSSYDAADVTFLLTDLTGVDLELPLAEREAAIQAGRNYAEMLPIEYAPEPRYLEVFDRLLVESASTIAEHVGVVTEMALAARAGQPVFVSLARAGTPVGILMRRWAEHAHGLDLAHYSISIVRGRGIDTTALDHIAARHDPAQIVFVDGWTGKGAITAELYDALDAYELQSGASMPRDLAVVADPGGCATLFGTRDDALLPSACLNSTVCGLVSRTVLNDALIRPGMFHGAKVYRELAAHDRSREFVDAVSSRFADVAPAVAARWRFEYDADRSATFAGLDVVRRVQREFGLPSWHLVKPSVGETTRVLLRRLPWRVLVRPDRRSDLEHVFVLAADRGVPIVDYPDMPYASIGLVRPTAAPGE